MSLEQLPVQVELQLVVLVIAIVLVVQRPDAALAKARLAQLDLLAALPVAQQHSARRVARSVGGALVRGARPEHVDAAGKVDRLVP